MDKNQIVHPVNYNDMHKFTKYYTKLNNLNDSNRNKVSLYEEKLNEYTSKLQQGGVNIQQVAETIQQGGIL